MIREVYRLLITAVVISLALACTKPSGDDEHARSRPAAIQPAPSQAASDTGSPEAELPVVEQVIEIASAELEQGPNTVPITPIEPAATSVRWRELGTYDHELALVPVASGVVARSSLGVYELDDDDTLVLRPGLVLPETPLLGRWPRDVWTVAAKPAAPGPEGQPQFSYQVQRLDRERRWVPVAYDGQQTWTGEAQTVRKGWLTGLLVRDGSTFTRLGSRKPAPKAGMRMGKQVVDAFESAGGNLYTVSVRATGVYVQSHCGNLDCVNENAKKLPFGSEWSFSTPVPRERKSLSMVASVNYEGTTAHHLLHYGIGNWRLESLVFPPTQLWPGPDGGLWLESQGKLLYRSPDSTWHDVALPEGTGEFSVAMHEDELLLATSAGGKTRVFAVQSGAKVLESAR